jgi:hypothetical protein
MNLFKEIKMYFIIRRLRKRLKNKSVEEVIKIITEGYISILISEEINKIINKELKEVFRE